jgi:hypothetical protein
MIDLNSKTRLTMREAAEYLGTATPGSTLTTVSWASRVTRLEVAGTSTALIWTHGSAMRKLGLKPRDTCHCVNPRRAGCVCNV